MSIHAGWSLPQKCADSMCDVIDRQRADAMNSRDPFLHQAMNSVKIRCFRQTPLNRLDALISFLEYPSRNPPLMRKTFAVLPLTERRPAYRCRETALPLKTVQFDARTVATFPDIFADDFIVGHKRTPPMA